MQNTTVESLFLVTFSDFFTIFRYSTEATKKTVPEITRTVRCKLSGNLLFQADPREVIVPVPDLRMVGFDGLPVVLTLGFFLLAVHAENVVIIL